MKKLISLTTLTALIICNSTIAWADKWAGNGTTNTYTKETGGADTNTSNSGTKNMTGTFTKSGPTYDVTISWEPLKFNYNSNMTWDGDSYDGSAKQWESATTTGSNMDVITVSNNSDVKVKADFSFTQDTRYIRDNCLTGLFTDYHLGYVEPTEDNKDDFPSSYILYSKAEPITDEQSTEQQVYFGVWGNPTNVVFPDNQLTNVPIGNVTVKISPFDS